MMLIPGSTSRTGHTVRPPDAGERVPILIVDDQPLNLDAIDAVLAPTGCRMVRAYSADEALLALLEQDFAAIMLDIRMPGMNGIDLAGPDQSPAAFPARADPVPDRAHVQRARHPARIRESARSIT